MLKDEDIKPGAVFVGLNNKEQFKIKEIKKDNFNNDNIIIIEYQDKNGNKKTTETNQKNFKRLSIINIKDFRA